MAENSKVSLSLMNLKVQIKSWEIAFAKQNGRKPGKSDIALDSTAKTMYIKYAKLKQTKENIPEPREMLTVEKVKPTAAGNVWGASLLKANSLPPDLDDHAPDGEKEPEKEDKKETVVDPLPCVRENLKKNLKQSFSPSMSTVFRKSRQLSETSTHNEKEHIRNVSSENNQNLDVLKKSQLCLPTNVSFCDPSLTNSLKKPKVFSMFGNRELVNKSVSLSWLNERSDDLSDLINLEKNVKTHNQTNENKTEITSTSILVETPKITENVSVSVSPYADKSPSSNENTLVKPGNTQETCTEFPKYIEIDEVTIPPRPTILSNVSEHVNNDNKTDQDFDEKVESQKNVGKAAQRHSGAKSSALASTNFRRLNMKQKTFSRKGGQGRFLRKQVFRHKLAKKGYSGKSGWKGRSGGASLGGGGGFRDKSEDKCFKCGESGHWASNCNAEKFKRKAQADREAQNKESWDKFLENLQQDVAQPVNSQQFLQTQITLEHAAPVYTQDDFNEDEVQSVLTKFGFSQFRPGQIQAIKRILLGEPTLLVLSTGSGKSLCYQLPAYMYAMKHSSITLVISPLVSLMDDQVHGLPKFLRATRLHSGMTKDQRENVMIEIQKGNVDILLVSPEALTSWAGMSPYYSPLAKLPPISFVCVDECHCLSEWSHSFRPSYLRVCKVLKDQLGIKCLVGLTATSTRSTCISVAKQLGITDFREGMILNMSLPRNLSLSISKDKYKDEALEMLLSGDRFRNLDSVIIYCTRRDEVVRVSSYLRTRLQREPAPFEPEPVEEFVEGKTKKRKRGTNQKSSKRRAVTQEAECYHAGMSAAQRRAVQKRFMSGKLRIVVATVAFGMGIDKHDVRAVIHYNMPRSFERYVQEVGRAGRDRLPAECHLFLGAEGEDLSELSRHTYGKSIDRVTVKKLVQLLFPPCKCSVSNIQCKGHYAAIPIDETIELLDVNREGLETLLCYLELDGLLDVFLPTECKCCIRCYSGSQQMQKTIQKCSAVAAAFKLKDKAELSGSEVDFSLDKVANEISFDIVSLKRTLRQLEWDTTLSDDPGKRGKSGVTVEFSGLSFLLHTKQACSNEFLDKVTENLYKRVISQERKELAQLKTCFNAMQKFSYPNAGCCMDDFNSPQSDQLKEAINAYFQEEANSEAVEVPEPLLSSDEDDIRSTVRQFLNVHFGDLGDQVTGRAIARILHGIESPRYPARSWGPARRFWRSKLKFDFNSVLKIATQELIKYR